MMKKKTPNNGDRLTVSHIKRNTKDLILITISLCNSIASWYNKQLKCYTLMIQGNLYINIATY